MKPAANKPNDIYAEFDLLADEYQSNLTDAIAITGETPDFFAEYKVADCRQKLKALNVPMKTILDFGSGIGNSIPYFRKYFPSSSILCAEVSERSIEVSKSRFPGHEIYLQITNAIPAPSNSIDIAFTACVFHHIPTQEHLYWIDELKRVLKPGGMLYVYEHNPINPLTVRAVKSSPLDVNAQLIPANEFLRNIKQAEFIGGEIAYKLFFPKWLSHIRFLELYLEPVCLGAQYRLSCFKPDDAS